MPVGTNPVGVAVSPDGARVYATDSISKGAMSIISTASNTVIATVPMVGLPVAVAVNSTGTRAYVVNNLNQNGFALPGSLTVIDTATNSVITTLAIGATPFAVAVDRSQIFVTHLGDGGNKNNVSLFDVVTNASLGTMTVGSIPAGIATFTPSDLPPLPTNVRVTGFEVTQAIQDLNNSVPLIAGRKTLVRVHTKAEGAAVPGVTATLFGVWEGCDASGTSCERFVLGSLTPTNPAGPRLTISPAPKRSVVDDSFLFELPWTWMNSSKALFLYAVLQTDPGPSPATCRLDAPHSVNHFDPPATLKPQFIRMAYPFVEVTPTELSQSQSVIRRTYPLSALVPTPNLRMYDAKLLSRVNRTAKECQDMPAAEQNLCAQRYVTNLLASLQATTGFMGDADVGYALIPQSPSGLFTRGACCTKGFGAGPSNVADYAAHEVMHFLGRDHPVEGAEECGHSATDPGYPYWRSFAGPGILGPTPSLHPETDLAGFDVGDSSLGIPMMHVYGQNAFDNIGYCKPSWISDYTYRKLYPCLLALHADLPGVTPSCGPAGGLGAGGPQTGDLLTLFGSITPDGSTPGYMQTQRVSRVVSIPQRTPGTYSSGH